MELEDGGVEEEEEEEEVKFIPDSPGGFMAVFCPLRLILHTGHVSCWREKERGTERGRDGERMRCFSHHFS